MYPVFIYALLDPRTAETRYVGQTPAPDRRLKEHIGNAKRKRYHSAYWIRSLLATGLTPVMEILDVVPDTESDFWEREYIQNFRERGFDLTNISDGGDAGMRGKKRSPETCAKISAAQVGGKRSLGRKLSPETRAKLRAALMGRKLSPEHRAKINMAQTPELRAKLSVAATGRKHSIDSRNKMSASHMGKKHSPETRAKMCAAHKKRPRP